jgi:hypothetical protein
MTCGKFEDDRLLAAYGEPAGAEFEAHRAFCDDCRNAIDQIRSVQAAYAATKQESMPASLRARFMGPRRLRWTLAAAAAALFAIFIALKPSAPVVIETPPPVVKIDAELEKIDQELGWHELVLGR